MKKAWPELGGVAYEAWSTPLTQYATYAIWYVHVLLRRHRSEGNDVIVAGVVTS